MAKDRPAKPTPEQNYQHTHEMLHRIDQRIECLEDKVCLLLELFLVLAELLSKNQEDPAVMAKLKEATDKLNVSEDQVQAALAAANKPPVS